MKPGKFIAFIVLISVWSFGFLFETDKKMPPPDEYISEILFSLGEPKPDHYVSMDSTELIEKGRQLIFNGRTTNPKGRKSKYISKFFKCTSCHNTVKEDFDLTTADAERRLEYAELQGFSHLQGSTFYGIVNRETWYNDDYVLKYGDLVKPAKNSLKESIQLCAKVCSQGRELEEWEMEAMLSYLWSIGLKTSDISSEPLFQNENSSSAEDRIKSIKSKYLLKSPATFGKVPEGKELGYPGLTGNAENGAKVYQLSCQHCHREQGESDVILDESVATLNWLKRNITSDSQLSIYEIIRKGTYSESGHKEYMPLYTKEKLSDQQIEDLRAYLEMER